MSKSTDAAARGSTKELLRRIDGQIDKVAFLYSNPTQAAQVAAMLGAPVDSSSVLAKCITRMERLSSPPGPLATAGTPSVRQQLEYLHERRAGAFDEHKCYSLLAKNRAHAMLSNRKAAIRTKGRTLSYEFKEKLTGFLSTRGCIPWPNDKIDDFIQSMMK